MTSTISRQPPKPTRPKKRLELVRGLDLTMATAIVVGTMVGTGIFLKPAEVAGLAGSTSWALAAWVVGGALTLLGALCYAELGTMMPEPGADYEYLKRAWNPGVGFLYGWKGFALTHPVSLASSGAGIALFASYIWPGLGVALFQAGAFRVEGGHIVAAAIILLITAINLMSIASVGRVQTLLTALKVASLMAVVAAGFFVISRQGVDPGTRTTGPGFTFAGFIAAVTATLWTYSGWHTLLRVGGEVKDPGRNLPRAMVGGFLLAGGLFLLVNIVCFAVLGFDRVASSRHVVSDMFALAIGPGAAGVLTLMMIVSALGSLNASAMASARVPYALARDGLLPPGLAHVNPRTRIPSVSVLTMSTLAIILVLTGSFEDLTSLFVFTQWGFLALGVAALIRLRQREPNAPRPVKVWGYPVTPLLFIGLTVVLTVSQFIERPLRSSLGLAMVLLGVPVYRWVSRRYASQSR